MQSLQAALFKIKSDKQLIYDLTKKNEFLNEQIKTLRHSNAGLVGENNKLRNEINKLNNLIKTLTK